MADVWPLELRVREKGGELALRFDNGADYVLSAEMLRVMSPSAEVQGHNPNERLVIGGKRNVVIHAVNPIGNYAVKLTFGDGHSSGIYTWDYLARLGREKELLWADYLADLERAGLTRDKNGSKRAAET